ncbi:MAG: tetratricopeptide repeat protein [Spirochaetia bacterium]|jgi:tetratricopeptide (TPR) repeat protein|nr:tetratricopeptide repeat protein [Spirochaetia bacterium]
MKKILFLLVLISIMGLFFSCNKTRAKTLERILTTESGDYADEEISRERIKELEESIEKYSKDVDRVVTANAEIGVYYRMLALEYFDFKLYKHALENLEKSMDYYPTNPVLYYYSGLSLANIARAEIDKAKSLSMLREAEIYYITAIKLRRTYSDAMYALAILYMFDLYSLEDARPLLENLLSLDPQNWEALSLYARYNVEIGDIDTAIELYNEISEKAWDDGMKEQAVLNRDSLLAGRL